jgi:hypothetical protein
MVLEIVPYTWEIDDHWDIEFGKNGWVANTRKFKYLRSVNSSCRKYYLS